MTAWSPEIANEFIRRASAEGRSFTQMQLQKLVYIAHGWSLALTGQPLTTDHPEAWDYGPVYKSLREAVRHYGSRPVDREIRNGDFLPAAFGDNPQGNASAPLTGDESAIIDRVYRDYGGYHAFQLSALTHREGTPWTTVYNGGQGRFDAISDEAIREHFVGLAQARRTPASA